MESKESQPPAAGSERGGDVLRPGANSCRRAPANTVTKNGGILSAFVPEKHETVHKENPPGRANHRCASASQIWERASAVKISSGSRCGSSSFLIRGSARVAAATPAS